MKMTQHWLMVVPYLPENYGNCAVKQRFRGSPAADHRVTWVRHHVAAFTTIARHPDNLSPSAYSTPVFIGSLPHSPKYCAAATDDWRRLVFARKAIVH